MATRSFGEDRPVDPGHDESAWRKNRRGEFVVLIPK
jgi:peptidoglycan-associated lipoprotein